MQFQIEKLDISNCNKQQLRRLQSEIGEKLARKMLSKVLERSPETLQFFRDKSGKPHLQDHACEFSISHAGPYVLCAVHEKAVGADIETVDTYRDRVAKRICTPAEFAYIEKDPIKFKEIWTRKEAYAKLTGKGLSFGLKKIPTADENGLTSVIANFTVSTVVKDDYVFSIVWELT